MGVDATDFEACTGIVLEGESLPADIFVMLDKSVSMDEHRVPEPDGPTRWDVVTEALTRFVTNEDAAGLGVGIQYFPLLSAPGDLNPVSCNVEDYAQADVPIGLLPDNAQAIIDSIDAQQLGSYTPSHPALEGALRHARAHAADTALRPVAVVYATDGFPTDCEPAQIPDLVNLAAAYASPSDDTVRVPTFVIGVGVGTDNALATNLDSIAEAGGTHRAHLVTDENAADNLTNQILRLATSPILCSLGLPEPPPGQQLEPALVNVRFSPAGAPAEIIGHVATADQCATQGGGWYYEYDDGPDADPTGIGICDSTCSFFGGGRVEVLLGCATYDLG